MSNFIAKISIAKFLLNFKVSEFEHELEPGDLAPLNTEDQPAPQLFLQNLPELYYVLFFISQSWEGTEKKVTIIL